jgi:hypothetical protein
VHLAARGPTHTPPCIRGQIIGVEQHDPLVLRSSLPREFPELDTSDISDQLLAEYLCQTRAVFPPQRNDDETTQWNVLLPLREVSPYRSQPEYIIVRSLADEDTPLTVMQVALV